MLTEEAHHMFVGDTGIARVVRRTLEVMRELGSDDPDAVRAPARSICRRFSAT
jgi:benzoyl-CoA 2,3-dioxygenase component B